MSESIIATIHLLLVIRSLRKAISGRITAAIQCIFAIILCIFAIILCIFVIILPLAVVVGFSNLVEVPLNGS